jgi:hypothetical protein
MMHFLHSFSQLEQHLRRRGRKNTNGFSEGMADDGQEPLETIAVFQPLPEPLGFWIALLHQLPEVRR